MKMNKWIMAVLTGAAVMVSAVPALAAGQPNSWIKETGASGVPFWNYLDETGEPVKGESREIGGAKYFFDEEGRMLWDWISKDGEQVDSGSGDGYLNGGLYFCGGPDEGQAAVGWKYIPVENEDGDLEKKWFYFREDGRKVSDGSIVEQENGFQYRYIFDENGVMTSSRVISAPDGYWDTEARWLTHTPSAEADPYGGGNTERWYYQKKNGDLVKDELRTIDGKEYLFDRHGIMRTGLVLVDEESRYVDTLMQEEDQIYCDSEDVKTRGAEYQVMYFDENSGARRSGNILMGFNDGTFTLSFRSNGQGFHGPNQGRLYDCGIRMEAEPSLRYEVKTVDGKDYLVNFDGKIQKPGRYQDKDGNWWRVESGSDESGYTVYGE